MRLKICTIPVIGMVALSACSGRAADADPGAVAGELSSGTMADADAAAQAQVPDHESFCDMVAELQEALNGFGEYLSPSDSVLVYAPEDARLTAPEAKALLDGFVGVAPAEIRSSVEALISMELQLIDLYEAADFDSMAISEADYLATFPDGYSPAERQAAVDVWDGWVGANCVIRPATQDRRAQEDLRNTLLSEKAVWTDTGAYTTTEAALQQYVPTVTTNSTSAADPGVYVSLSVAGNDDAVCLVQQSQSGNFFALFDEASSEGGTFYGASAVAIACPPRAGVPITSTAVTWSNTGFPAVP